MHKAVERAIEIKRKEMGGTVSGQMRCELLYDQDRVIEKVINSQEGVKVSVLDFVRYYMSFGCCMKKKHMLTYSSLRKVFIWRRAKERLYVEDLNLKTL